MIISHTHRFIFVKSYKTAGTSVEIALSRYLGDADIITPVSRRDEALRRSLGYRGPQNYRKRFREIDSISSYRFLRNLSHYLVRRDHYWLNGGPVLTPPHHDFWNHIPARDIKAKVPHQVWENYYKFSIERNPWSYVKSLYDYRRKMGLSCDTLTTFIEQGGHQHIDNFDLYSIDGAIAVDEVLLYEDLGPSLSRLSSSLGLPGDLGKDIVNIQAKPSSAPTTNYRTDYTERSRELVRQRFSHVCDLFGYRF